MSRPVYTDDWFEVSKAYNEDAIAWSCTTMLFVLHEMPNNFEDIVSDHFHNRACETLNAVSAYGVVVLLLVGIKRYDRVKFITFGFLVPGLARVTAARKEVEKSLYIDGTKEGVKEARNALGVLTF
ncbi:hypothetical protein RHSIM_Rhsim04G0239800 [Rhododendron simsii]|uniref:Uncharacterized protein n=1 Tax=Rhododendron simsii TaxID=118357 RepID=A0A834H2I7_RHOSS|nr:hypothetical protein RHSIM_Rhsim04G0239800 [Rhododendron simsii]